MIIFIIFLSLSHSTTEYVILIHDLIWSLCGPYGVITSVDGCYEPLLFLYFYYDLLYSLFIFALLDHENTFPFLSFPLYYICPMRPPYDSPHDLLLFLSMTHS